MATHVMTALYEPCMKYKKAYNVADMSETKLKQDWPGTRSRMCLVFSGTEGVEGLLQVRECFDAAVASLQLTTGDQHFAAFQQCMTDTAESRWMNVVNNNIPPPPRTIPMFRHVFSLFLKRYCTPMGCDHMVDYLKSTNVTKPHDTSCDEHAERLSTLIHYTNQLPSVIPVIDGAGEKTIIFQSFPLRWKRAYTGVCFFVNNDTADIIQFMAVQKLQQDEMEQMRCQANAGNRGCGSPRGRRIFG